MGRSVGPWGDVYAKPKAVPKPKGELRVVRERPQGAPRNKTIMALAGEPSSSAKRRWYRRGALQYVAGLEQGHRKKDRTIQMLRDRIAQLEREQGD